MSHLKKPQKVEGNFLFIYLCDKIIIDGDFSWKLELLQFSFIYYL